jgi:hypothetical protein
MWPTFATNRDALHRIAEEVVSPAIAFEDREVTYGGSPGDENHAEPYIYVAPWTKPEPAPQWNAVGFDGAGAPWTDEAAALAFFRERRDELCRRSTGS